MNFLQGTYGFDFFSLFLIVISFIFNLWDVTRIFGTILIVYAIYRAFSKKVYKRKQEYNLFHYYINKVLNKFGKSLPMDLPIIPLTNLTVVIDKFNNWFIQRKNYKITKCPNCKQKLRLPRGKGNIVVTCKKCNNKFDFRT